jgi:hypothetical protein
VRWRVFGDYLVAFPVWSILWDAVVDRVTARINHDREGVCGELFRAVRTDAPVAIKRLFVRTTEVDLVTAPLGIRESREEIGREMCAASPAQAPEIHRLT